MIPYSKQSVTKTDINYVIKSLKSDLITQGKKIIEFEDKLSKYTKSKYSIVSNSGTSSLHSACFALNIKKNDIVWTTPLSFVATSNCALYFGAEINFIDIEKNTGLIDLKLLEKKLKNSKKDKLPKLIIVVHYAGQSCDMKSIYKLKKKYHFSVIEDASHAIGSEYLNTKVGSCKYSDITTFSFHPVKNITTGEGGASLTNHKKYYEKMKLFINHGINKNIDDRIIKNQPWIYNQEKLGYNYRLTDFQASLGISQLKKIDHFKAKKIKLKKIYDQSFKKLPINILKINHKNKICQHLYVIFLKNHLLRLKLYKFLLSKGIKTQIHYIPIYKHDYYKKKNYFSCPNCEEFYNTALSIPFYSSIRIKDLKRVIREINIFFKNEDI